MPPTDFTASAARFRAWATAPCLASAASILDKPLIDACCELSMVDREFITAIADEVRTETATVQIYRRRIEAEDKISDLLPPLTDAGAQALARLILARDNGQFEDLSLKSIACFVAQQRPR